MKEFTHPPRGLVHLEGKLVEETSDTITVRCYKGKIVIKKCDVFNCHVRTDKTINVDVSPVDYPRAKARTRPRHVGVEGIDTPTATTTPPKPKIPERSMYTDADADDERYKDAAE